MKLSIIIPVYNLEEYIATTIESLLKINMPYDYEIIVVNDGSTDNSERIIQQYVEINRQVNVITIQNGGVSNARNIGLEKASGEYIAFVDGDDIVDEKFFLWAINEADKNNYDIVQGDYWIVEDDNLVFRTNRKEEIILSYQQMVEALLGANKIIDNAVWGKVFRKECIDNVYFDINISIGEDQKFIFDVLKKVKKILISNKIAYYYVQRNSSAIHRMDIMKERDKLEVLSYCKKGISNKVIIKNIEWHEINILITIYTMMVCQRITKQTINDVYGEIRKYRLKDIWRKLSGKQKIMYYMIYNFRYLYDFWVKKRIQNENRNC